jgi:hypothetical protein
VAVPHSPNPSCITNCNATVETRKSRFALAVYDCYEPGAREDLTQLHYYSAHALDVSFIHLLTTKLVLLHNGIHSFIQYKKRSLRCSLSLKPENLSIP